MREIVVILGRLEMEQNGVVLLLCPSDQCGQQSFIRVSPRRLGRSRGLRLGGAELPVSAF